MQDQKMTEQTACGWKMKGLENYGQNFRPNKSVIYQSCIFSSPTELQILL